jgi:hypothetical protein
MNNNNLKGDGIVDNTVSQGCPQTDSTESDDEGNSGEKTYNVLGMELSQVEFTISIVAIIVILSIICEYSFLYYSLTSFPLGSCCYIFCGSSKKKKEMKKRKAAVLKLDNDGMPLPPGEKYAFSNILDSHLFMIINRISQPKCIRIGGTRFGGRIRVQSSCKAIFNIGKVSIWHFSISKETCFKDIFKPKGSCYAGIELL